MEASGSPGRERNHESKRASGAGAYLGLSRWSHAIRTLRRPKENTGKQRKRQRKHDPYSFNGGMKRWA